VKQALRTSRESDKQHRSPVIPHAMKGINEELIKCRFNEPVINYYRNRRLLFPIVRIPHIERSMQSKNLHVHYSFISILYSYHGRESATVTKRREKKRGSGRDEENHERNGEKKLGKGKK